MTEMDWLTGVDPEPMLDFFCKRASQRKQRLLAVACCRLGWHWLDDPRAHAGVEAAERWADGRAGPEEARAAQGEARRALKEACWAALRELDREGILAAWRRGLTTPAEVCVREAAAALAVPSTGSAPASPRRPACIAYGFLLPLSLALDIPCYAPARHEILGCAMRLLPALIRDLHGNPYRPVFLNPAWLLWHGPQQAASIVQANEAATDVMLPVGRRQVRDEAWATGRDFSRPSWQPWQEGTVRQMAQSIYEERAFERLPELADALEAAGCADPDILTHCRSSLPHARGCWLLDAILCRQGGCPR